MECSSEMATPTDWAARGRELRRCADVSSRAVALFQAQDIGAARVVFQRDREEIVEAMEDHSWVVERRAELLPVYVELARPCGEFNSLHATMLTMETRERLVAQTLCAAQAVEDAAAEGCMRRCSSVLAFLRDNLDAARVHGQRAVELLRAAAAANTGRHEDAAQQRRLHSGGGGDAVAEAEQEAHDAQDRLLAEDEVAALCVLGLVEQQESESEDDAEPERHPANANRFDENSASAKAERFLVSAIEVCCSRLGKQHYYHAGMLNNLALNYQHRGRLAEAETYLTRAAQLQEQTLGLRHPDASALVSNLATLLMRRAQLGDTHKHCLAAAALRRAIVGQPDEHVAESQTQLAEFHASCYDSAMVAVHQRFALAQLATAAAGVGSGLLAEVVQGSRHTAPGAGAPAAYWSTQLERVQQPGTLLELVLTHLPKPTFEADLEHGFTIHRYTLEDQAERMGGIHDTIPIDNQGGTAGIVGEAARSAQLLEWRRATSLLRAEQRLKIACAGAERDEDRPRPAHTSTCMAGGAITMRLGQLPFDVLEIVARSLPAEPPSFACVKRRLREAGPMRAGASLAAE